MAPPADDAVRSLLDKLAGAQLGDNGDAAPPREHKFWKTQPVPQTLEDAAAVAEEGPLEPARTPADVRQTPYTLPAGFEWVEIDIDDDHELDEVYALLLENYVEDSSSSFRFGYSKSLIKWALKPPGWKKEWHVGVRLSSTRKLVAFISGIPSTVAVNARRVPMVDINFLCVLKKLRSKRMAPVLIKEITRRVNLHNIWQALYTAGAKLPGSIGKAVYWHRSLQPQKLIETGFGYLPPGKTMDQHCKNLKLSKAPRLHGIRPMLPRDVPSVTKHLNSFLTKYALHPEFNEEEAAHWFLPVPETVYSYVVEDPASGHITHFVSFFRIPSKVLNHPVHSEIRAAYSFYYYYPQSDSALENHSRIGDLFHDALYFAKQEDHDVFNTLALMDNQDAIDQLKYVRGDGALHYYLYNWATKPMPGSQIGALLM